MVRENIVLKCKVCEEIISSNTGEDLPRKKKNHMSKCHPGFEEVYNKYKE